jgi:hypothetical protein
VASAPIVRAYSWSTLLLLAGLSLLPSACGGLVAPFEGVPRLPEPGVIDAGPRVGVCYNAMFTTPQEVRRLAREACGSSGTPQPIEQDMRLAGCPLLTPVRASFVCTPE